MSDNAPDTVEKKSAYLAEALQYAAAYDGRGTKYQAMLGKYSEEDLRSCMSLQTIRRRVKSGSIDGSITSKGGSRTGCGRKRQVELVTGELRKRTKDRERVRESRQDAKQGERVWRDITFEPVMKQLVGKAAAIGSILTLAKAARMCFNHELQSACPVYQNGKDVSYVRDIDYINPKHQVPTTGQQRRIILPTPQQKHKENLPGLILP